MSFARLQFASIFAAVALAGCGGSSGDKWMKDLPPTVDATGVILMDGNPLEGAAIVLAPADDPEGHAAMALSGSGGYFKLKAFPSKDGAVAGSYQVAVTRSEEAAANVKAMNWGEDAAHAEASPATTTQKNSLPEQYADPVKSGLTLTIPEDGTSDLKIELTSAP